jgi:hypothetical protein
LLNSKKAILTMRVPGGSWIATKTAGCEFARRPFWKRTDLDTALSTFNPNATSTIPSVLAFPTPTSGANVTAPVQTSPSAKPSISVSAIIGGSIGAAVVLCLAIGGAFWSYVYYKRSIQPSRGVNIEDGLDSRQKSVSDQSQVTGDHTFGAIHEVISPSDFKHLLGGTPVNELPAREEPQTPS